VAEKVLIVEDEPEFAGLLEIWMEKSGYRPVIATTGREALRRFYDEHPDLVILDVALPELDGWQVIERIREFSRVPILMVTARSSEADKIRGLKLGADDYITKPLSFPELLARVEAALRRASTPTQERPRRLQHRDGPGSAATSCGSPQRSSGCSPTSSSTPASSSPIARSSPRSGAPATTPTSTSCG
jgi:DNA-binding response OmpR family regulator